QTAGKLESLGGPRNASGGPQKGRKLLKKTTQRVARNNHQQVAAGLYRLPQIALDPQRCRKRRVRQIALVAPLALHRRELHGIAAPQNRDARARRLYGERGSPRSGAQHGDGRAVGRRFEIGAHVSPKATWCAASAAPSVRWSGGRL